MSIDITIDAREMLEAIARLSKYPLATVIRNASRDFARGAKQATPLAKISKSQYYTYIDPKTNQRKYLHERQVMTGRTRTGNAKMSAYFASFKDENKLHKVRVAKGYSKATWLGVFSSLGMTDELPKVPNGLSAVAMTALQSKSKITMQESDHSAEATITDRMPLNHFGKGAQNQGAISSMIQAGYARASVFIAETWLRLTKQLWEGRK